MDLKNRQARAHNIAIVQFGVFNPGLIDVGPVLRAKVTDHVGSRLRPLDNEMLFGHPPIVINAEVGLGGRADHDGVTIVKRHVLTSQLPPLECQDYLHRSHLPAALALA